jgi:hypothetical protein
MRLIKSIKSKLSLFIDIIISIILIIILFRIIIGEKAKITESVPILEIKKEWSFVEYNPSVRRSALIDLLQGRVEIQQNIIISLENSLMQLRNIYAAILVGFLAILFYDEKSDKNENNKKKDRFVFIFLITIGSIYFLDLHYEDWISRQYYSKDITVTAVDSLINLNPMDNTWYIVNYKKFHTQMNTMKAYSRIYRKYIYNASAPSIFQFVFYIIPWFVIYYNLGRSFLKRKFKN